VELAWLDNIVSYLCPLNVCRFPNFNLTKKSVSQSESLGCLEIHIFESTFRLLIPHLTAYLQHDSYTRHHLLNKQLWRLTSMWLHQILRHVTQNCYVHPSYVIKGNSLFIQSPYRASDMFIKGACKISRLVFHSSFCKEAAFPGPQMLMRFTRTLTTKGITYPSRIICRLWRYDQFCPGSRFPDLQSGHVIELIWHLEQGIR
jgi:hypothetical protein